MKRIRYIGAAFLAVAFVAAVSCDKIKENDRLVDQGIFELKTERCVLLEDYTGVRCVNCPNAAAEIKTLQAAYGSNLVVVGMYPQNPQSLTQPYGTDPDLRTDAAQAYATHYQIEQFPQGMVNRKEVLAFAAWGGAIQNVFDDTATDYVNLTASAQLSGSNLQVTINGNFKKDYPNNGNINVIAMIVEDNINARQLTSSGVDGDYIHNHVLRAVISEDIWGDEILGEHPAQDESFTKEYTTTLNEVWNTENLALVVAVVNANSREVLQAAYAHLK